MKRNKFNLSHYKIGSCDMGKIYPISCYEVLPGDTIQQSTSVFLRFAPMLGAVMHPVRVSTYTFYTPLRLLWNEFEDYITGGPDGLDVSVPPQIQDRSTDGVRLGSVWDYLGVPVGYKGYFSAFPGRAYYKIFNEYFRDQDLDPINPPANSLADFMYGSTSMDGGKHAYSTNPTPKSASWEKDYFTTCRPWPQKGAEVTVPVNSPSDTTLGINGDIKFKFDGTWSSSQTARSGNISGYQVNGDTGEVLLTSSLATSQWGTASIDEPTGNNKIIADLSDLSVRSSTDGSLGNVRLDALREAFALQRFQEARAMYGSRYTEYLRYLGVRSSDARLQRPEYLGGSKQTIQFSEVLQTAADGDYPVGTLRGHGIGASKSRPFRRFIEEHGLIMTLLVIRPIAIYMQGLNKMWSREVKEDYWQKELQHIGQQEVKTKELYALGSDPDSVFGFQNRYDDYRSVPSTVCGEMRTTLNYWHLARDFANEPVLNSSFIYGQPTKRIFAEQTMNEIYFMAQNSIVARRLLSKTGNPIL